jgi:predicted HicB family RNase H-like nuclease
MDEKRFTLRMSPELFRRLRIQAAKRDKPVAHLINEWLAEKVTEAETACQHPTTG